MGCYVTHQQALVDFYLKDGTVIRARPDSLDTDNESVVGITSDGRHFAVPIDNINHVLEV
jgi:hypothetical protein